MPYHSYVPPQKYVQYIPHPIPEEKHEKPPPEVIKEIEVRTPSLYMKEICCSFIILLLILLVLILVVFNQHSNISDMKTQIATHVTSMDLLRKSHAELTTDVKTIKITKHATFQQGILD